MWRIYEQDKKLKIKWANFKNRQYTEEMQIVNKHEKIINLPDCYSFPWQCDKPSQYLVTKQPLYYIYQELCRSEIWQVTMRTACLCFTMSEISAGKSGAGVTQQLGADIFLRHLRRLLCLGVDASVGRSRQPEAFQVACDS